MCDCYEHNCDHSECKNHLPIHLADFSTDREEIKVYCGSHISKHKDEIAQGVLYKVSEGNYEVLIVPLTDNARQNWQGNHPNESYFSVISVFGDFKVEKDGK